MNQIPDGPLEVALAAEQTGLTLSEIVAIVWRRRLRVVASVVAALIVAVIYLKGQTPLYTASMLVMPAEQQTPQAGGGGGLGLQLLSGLGRGSNDETFLRYLQTFGTTSFGERLETRHNLVRRVFAGQWDEATRRWRKPTGVTASIRSGISGFFGLPSYADPSPTTLAAYLDSKIDDSQVGTSPIYRISFSHPDSGFAVELLDIVNREANATLREEAAAATRLKMASLQARIAATTESEHRAMLFSLLAEQQRRLMLLDPRLPYAAVVVDAPVASALPTSPRPLLSLALATLLGLFVGIAACFVPDRTRAEASG